MVHYSLLTLVELLIINYDITRRSQTHTQSLTGDLLLLETKENLTARTAIEFLSVTCQSLYSIIFDYS